MTSDRPPTYPHLSGLLPRSPVTLEDLAEAHRKTVSQIGGLLVASGSQVDRHNRLKTEVTGMKDDIEKLERENIDIRTHLVELRTTMRIGYGAVVLAIMLLGVFFKLTSGH